MPTSPGHRDLTHQHTAGAAYVFRHNGTDWDEEQILSADTDEQANADFGTSVDVDDDAIIVGAPRYDESSNSAAGKAYIFRYAGGSWSEEDAVVAGDVEAGARFGESVSISDGRVAIGAIAADYTGGTPISDTGAVYIFELGFGGFWSQSFKLHASDKSQGDGFAIVSLEGDRLLVGAQGKSSNTGACYLLEYSGLAFNPPHWAEEQIITASDGNTDERFGNAVALDGDRLVVGAAYADAGSTNAAGAAYVLDYVSNDWDETVKLTALVPLVPSVATHSLNDHRARMLDPITGRFLTRDPWYYGRVETRVWTLRNDSVRSLYFNVPGLQRNSNMINMLIALTPNPKVALDPTGLAPIDIFTRPCKCCFENGPPTKEPVGGPIHTPISRVYKHATTSTACTTHDGQPGQQYCYQVYVTMEILQRYQWYQTYRKSSHPKCRLELCGTKTWRAEPEKRVVENATDEFDCTEAPCFPD